MHYAQGWMGADRCIVKLLGGVNEDEMFLYTHVVSPNTGMAPVKVTVCQYKTRRRSKVTVL